MFKLEFETGNAAFEDNRLEEAARILEDVAKRLRTYNNGGYAFGPCVDLNGNRVGSWGLGE